MNTRTNFATLARYNAWATRRLLDGVAALGEDDYRRDVGLFFKSVHGPLNHLLLGEHGVWFERFAGRASPRVDLGAEVEPNRTRLAERLLEGAARWQPLIESWPAERFGGTLDYATTKGVPLSLPFAATLAHVFNHGTHLRFHFTAALTALGQPCPELDLVYMLQQEQAKP